MKNSIVQIHHTYISRFQVKEPYFTELPAEDLCLIIAIPAYKEPDILSTLRSLSKCQQPSGSVEIIISVNAPENSPEGDLMANQKCMEQIEYWIEKEMPANFSVKIIREEALPKKHAGAGLARKIGMDEALHHWKMAEKDGPIICLDADCTVSENYLVESTKAFQDEHTKVGHFHFCHQYQKEEEAALREGILNYELHLRYYIQGLKWAGFPFAVHTVGSSMAVRASSYAKAGGMNKRKAGEDFYFLHKLAPLGGWKDITSATVFPSCRASDRVPFGTGKAQSEFLESDGNFLSYHPEIFEVMSTLFSQVKSLSSGDHLQNETLHPAIMEFLEAQDYGKKLKEFRGQSSSPTSFEKRFWSWMDGFLVLKLTHFLRDHGFSNQPIKEGAQVLLQKKGVASANSLEELLIIYRQLDLSP